MRRWAITPVRTQGLHCRLLLPQGHRPGGFREGFGAVRGRLDGGGRTGFCGTPVDAGVCATASAGVAVGMAGWRCSSASNPAATMRCRSVVRVIKNLVSCSTAALYASSRASKSVGSLSSMALVSTPLDGLPLSTIYPPYWPTPTIRVTRGNKQSDARTHET